MLASLGGSEAKERLGDINHMTVFGDDLETGKIVALANFEIVEIVSWGDLDCASAVFGVGVLVGNQRDEATGEGKHELERLVAREILSIPGIAGVDCDRHVSE